MQSCYEAGRDMFWVHRALEAHGIRNVVVDPSSIAVDRRHRRAKTDRVDATALVMQLMNAAAGDRRGWREVRVPSVEAEHDRQLQREWETVREDRKRVRNRIAGLLATQGIALPLTGQFLRRLATARLWDGSAVAAPLVHRLEREWTALQAVEARRRALERLRGNAWSKLLAYAGIGGGIAYLAVVIGQVLQSQLLIAIVAGVGGVILIPIWFIWLGLRLRKAG